MDQKEEGSITVFLSIIFLLFFAMLGVTFENVRSLVSTGYVRTAAYSAAVTAFGDYNKELYQDYGLFAYGGTEGKNVSDLVSAYNRILLENISAAPAENDRKYTDLFLYTDIDAVIKSAKYITDSNEFSGQVISFLKQEAVTQIKDNLLRKGEDTDKEEIQNRLAMTKEYEQGKYDSSADHEKTKENTNDVKQTQEKREVSKQQTEKREVTDSAGGNPLKAFTALARDGILGLVCDEDKLEDGTVISCQEDNGTESQKEDDTKNKGDAGKISDVSEKKEETESEAGEILDDLIRKNQEEKENTAGPAEKISMISYANKVFSSYTQEQDRTTKYGLEYLVGGKQNEKDNLAAVINRLLVIRLLLNFTYVMSDAGLLEKSLATATAIAGITGLPPVINAVQYTILLILAFEEACVDVRALLTGKKIPSLKKASDFQMRYEEICMGSKQLFDQKAAAYPKDDGKQELSAMSYRQYLWSFLFITSQDALEKRIFDLIEYDLREKYNQTFCIHTCICNCSYQITYQVPFQFQNLPYLENSLFSAKYSYKSLEVHYGYKSK